MAYLLHLEMATNVCSVAIANDGALLSLKETNIVNSHSSLITVYVEAALKTAGIGIKELNAVCVSKGPGSYTGLRIGVSTAKGFCYSLNIPLIAVNTLQSMARLFSMEFPKEINEETFLCPMIDARRMEVFTAVFDYKINCIQKTSAIIIDEHSFAEMLQRKKIIFFGDGAAKCRQILSGKTNAVFNEQFQVSAKGMITDAWHKYQDRQFEDVAYFEPFYLKDFIATVPRKKL